MSKVQDVVTTGYKDKENNRRILTEMKRLGLIESFTQEKGYIVTTDAGTKAMLYYEHVEYTDKYMSLTPEEKDKYAKQIKDTIRKRRRPKKPKSSGAELIIRILINEDGSRYVTFFVGKAEIDDINQGAMYAIHKEGGIEISAGLFTKIRTIVKPAKNFRPHLDVEDMFERWKFVEFIEGVDRDLGAWEETDHE